MDSGPYFHGGAAGLDVGDSLVPRSGLAPDHAVLNQPVVLDDPTADDQIYVTSREDIAKAWAIRFIADLRGDAASVYRVDVGLGEIERDPDWPDAAESFMVKSAVVAEVHIRRVHVNLRAATRTLGPYMTWENGDPSFDKGGYALPAPEWVGVTATQLRQFGTWPHPSSIGYDRFSGRMRKLKVRKPGSGR
jgi:hypothetical protein